MEGSVDGDRGHCALVSKTHELVEVFGFIGSKGLERSISRTAPASQIVSVNTPQRELDEFQSMAEADGVRLKAKYATSARHLFVLALLFIVVFAGAAGCASENSNEGTGKSDASTTSDERSNQDNSSEDDADQAAVHLRRLRRQLAEAQKHYSRALENGSDVGPGAKQGQSPRSETTRKTPTTEQKAGQLRHDLREQVRTMLQDMSGSEVQLAVRRAEIEVTLERIQALEEAFGTGKGARTTEFNVLSIEELRDLEARAYKSLAAFERHAVSFPRQERPMALLGRIDEVRLQRQALRAELNARDANSKPIGLIEVDAELSFRDALTRSHRVASVERSVSERFRTRVAYQIRLRQSWAAKDPYLMLLAKNFSSFQGPDKPPPSPKGPPRTGPDPPSGPRPSSPSPKPDTPGANPVAGMAKRGEGGNRINGPPWTKIEDTAVREVQKMVEGDWVGAAQERARLRALGVWANEAVGLSASDTRPRMASISTDALIKMRSQLRALALEMEKSGIAYGTRLDRAEIIKGSLRTIDQELARRHLPHREPAPPIRSLVDIEQLLSGKPRSSDAQQLFPVREARTTLLELEKLAQHSFDIPKLKLAEAQAKAKVDLWSSQVALLEDAEAQIERSARRLMTHGRGENVSKVGAEVVATKRHLRSAAAGLTQQLVNSSILEARELLVRVDPLRSGVSAASSPSFIDIEDIVRRANHLNQASESLASVDSSSIRLKAGLGLPEDKSIRIRLRRDSPSAPKDFERLFPVIDGWDDRSKIIQDIRSAPGGIILDAELDNGMSSALREVRIDTATNRIVLTTSDGTATLPSDFTPVVARIAWSFVLDGRVVAVDLRNLDTEEVLNLAGALASRPLKSMSDHETEELTRLIHTFTSVNLHPAFVNTEIGNDLILADQLIFNVLPAAHVRLEGEEIRLGIDTSPLRNAYNRDLKFNTRVRRLRYMLFRKSILSAVNVSLRLRGGGAELVTQLDFSIWELPRKVDRAVEPLSLRHSSDWFNTHQLELKSASEVLSRVSRFAGLVALLSAVREKNIRNNFDDLLMVVTPFAQTPRFICESRRGGGCSSETARALLDKSELP